MELTQFKIILYTYSKISKQEVYIHLYLKE